MSRVRRSIPLAFAVLIVVALSSLGYAYFQFQRMPVEKLDESFHVVWGGGGNSSILSGPEGLLLVDTKFLRPGWRLAGLVRSLSPAGARVIINTHYHQDHTHGNANYPPGTRVIAQRRTRAHLIQRDKRFWEVEPAWSLLPQDLVEEASELDWGEEHVRVLHLGAGHTDGDVVVHFVQRRLLQTGDLFVHGVYPRIDRKAGGSARQWIATLDRLLAIEGVDRYIPGHGSMAERHQVERFQTYLRSLVEQVERLTLQGKHLDEVEASVDLRGFDDWRGIPFLTSRSKNIASVYEEIAKERMEIRS